MSKKTISKMLFSDQERVELSMAKDMIAIHKEVASRMQEIKSIKSKALQEANKFIDIYTRYEIKVGQVGFDPHPKAVKQFQEIKQFLKELKQMPKQIQIGKIVKPKVKRKGVHAKTKMSSIKGSKLYKKKNRGQG